MQRSGYKRVLVTGGAGFLGSHLCERLLKDGNEVICLDNFYTGSRSNIEHLLSNPMFTVLEHDVTNPLYLQIDEIYNLACPASPIHYQSDPVHTTKTSVIGMINMLGLAKRSNAKIMHASTSEVYGDPQVHPQPESYWGHVNPTGTRSCYDEGKRCAETLCFDYHRRHNLDVKVVRIFNTYGPKMHPDDGRVVSNFVVQALKGEPITVYGDGSQTRSFCYVDDLIEGFVRMMATPPGVTGPINLGNPGEFTIRELAHEVLAMTNSDSPIIEKPLPSDDPRQRQPNIEKAKQILDWEPLVSLKEGLVHTVNYFDGLVERTATHTKVATLPRRTDVQARSKNVLVTGGAGYIGSHACKALFAAGLTPVTLDNLVYGHEWAVNWGPFVKGDLADKDLLRQTIREYNIGAIMHFAAYAYVGESMDDPGKYFNNNVTNTVNLLDTMVETGVENIVFSSTCATYGVPTQVSIDENHPQQPINPYGESKLFIERALRWYGEAHGIRAYALRYFNAAGADLDGEIGEDHDPETHLIPLVIQTALGMRPELKIFGIDYDTPDGSAVRDYIHVTDLATAHVSAVDRLIHGGASQFVNLGTGTGHSVKEVVSAVERVSGLPVNAVEAPRRPGDPPMLVAKPGAAAKLLDWTPRHSDLETIVATALRWHQKQLEMKAGGRSQSAGGAQ